MTFHNDKDIKEKWLKRYREEIYLNKEKRDLERDSRIREERENLDRVQRQMEEERNNENKKKQDMINENMDEYYKYLEKRKDDIQKFKEERKEKKEVSLDIKNEERVNMLKERINHLDEMVDKNMKNYIDYTLNPIQPPNVNKNKEYMDEDLYREIMENNKSYLQEAIQNDLYGKSNVNNSVSIPKDQNPNNFHNSYNGLSSSYNHLPIQREEINKNVYSGKGLTRTDVTSQDILERAFNKNYQEFRNVNTLIYIFNNSF